jgi:hypothetical protein|tara:strand:- start:490 stop:1380 length:891 start_codon:yes stop_codon:yes gene_type:complete
METKLIMENWKKFNENPFQLMLEQYDRKVINETQLYERWERQTIREFNQIQKQLLEEGLLDTLKAAGQKVGDFLKGVSEKVSDFVLKKSIQIVEMAKKATFAALRAAKKLYDIVADFCSDRPLFCKIVGMALLVIIVYLIAAIIYSPSAQAKLTQGGKPIDSAKFNFIKGVTNDLVSDKTSKASKNIDLFAKALKELQQLQDSPKDFPVEKLEGLSKQVAEFGSSAFDDLLATAKDKSLQFDDRKDAFDLLDTMIDLGKRTRAVYEEVYIKTRSEFGSSTFTKTKAAIDTLKQVPK